MLGSAVLDYLCALADPASCTAGLPLDPVQPSFKLHSWAKGDFIVGATTGYIAICPSAANDSASIFYTGAAFAGTTIGTIPPPIAGVAAANTNSPYATAAFGTTLQLLQQRLVSAVIKVSPAIAPLNITGSIYGLQHPDHQTIGTYAAVNFNSMDEASRKSSIEVLGKAIYLRYHPIFGGEEDFVPSPSFWTVTNPFMGFLVTGTTNDVWTWEVHYVHEIIGYNANPRTPSYNDPVGMAAVTNAFSNSVGLLRPTMDDGPTTTRKLISAASSALATMTSA